MTGVSLPDNNPLSIVASMGVFVLVLIAARGLKRTPSLAIAYSTRGNGNMAPSRLVQSAHTAPPVTSHLTTGIPT